MKGRLSNFLGFTLIELMIVVAIIAFLAMIAVPNFLRYVAKAKRAEVYLNLGAIYTAQKAFWAEHGTYSPNLTGTDGIGWKPEGEINYTYGFPGSEGTNYFTGKLKAPASQLSGIAKADKESFTAAAIGDIDGDNEPDIVTINDKREIKILKDDLA